MSGVFEKIRAKITRAEQHIQDFDLGVRAFVNSKPYEIAIKEDANAGKRIYYLERVNQPPHALAAIAADVIQNLRSSLDHAAYQLVLSERGGAEPDWNVYFPITRDPADYQARRGGCIKGVRQAIIDAIDATEPYRGGKGHALWQINEVNRPDKHRLLTAIGGYCHALNFAPVLDTILNNTKLPLGRPIPPFFLKTKPPAQPLKAGYELLVEPLHHEMTKNMQFAYHISIDAPGIIEPEPAIKTLKDFSNLVSQIIDSFRPFFP